MSKKIEKLQSLIFGIHPILELLKAKKRKLLTIYTTKPVPKSVEPIMRILPPSTAIQYVTRDVLSRIAGTTDHQGIVGWTTEFKFASNFFDPVKQPFLVMLDGVQDPRNLGAIVRSAYCTNVNGVILLRRKSAPLNAVAFKASAGLAEYVSFYEAPSPAAAVVLLKKAGYSIYLAALGGENATKIQYRQPLCIVIGSESSGISPEIAQAGTKVMLPQRDPDISYNASVAAGILLFFIAVQHHKI